MPPKACDFYVDPKIAAGFAKLYGATHKNVSHIVDLVGNRGQITKSVTHAIAKELEAARIHYNNHALIEEDKCVINNAMDALLEINKDGMYIHLKKVASLQRFLNKIGSVQGNGLDVNKSSIYAKILEMNKDPNQISPTPTEIKGWFAAFKYIGRPNSRPDVTLVTVSWLEKQSTSDRVWSGREFHLQTINPMVGPEFKKAIADATKISKVSTVNDKGGKRAAALPVILAYLASVYISIMADLDAFQDMEINDPSNKLLNESLFRRAQVMMFIAIAMTSPARGIEILTHTLDDWMEDVEGYGKFPLLLRVLMHPTTLPRALLYHWRRWFGKLDKSTTKEKFAAFLQTFVHDVIPIFASAYSAPDVCLFSMTLMMRLQTMNLLSSATNPGMHIFRGTGDKPDKLMKIPKEVKEMLGMEDEEDLEVEDDDDVALSALQLKLHAQKRNKRKAAADVACTSASANAAAKAAEAEADELRNRVPFGTGKITTSKIDEHLKRDIPPGAVRKSGLSGYSFRTCFAICMDKMQFMHNNVVRATLVRRWFGHSPTSGQIFDYAKGVGRCVSCLVCHLLSDAHSITCACATKRAYRGKAKAA